MPRLRFRNPNLRLRPGVHRRGRNEVQNVRGQTMTTPHATSANPPPPTPAPTPLPAMTPDILAVAAIIARAQKQHRPPPPMIVWPDGSEEPL